MFNEQPIWENSKKRIAALKERVYQKAGDIAMTAFLTKEPLPYARREEGTPRGVAPGDAWGEVFDCAWFRLRFHVPEERPGRKPVLVLDLGGEGLVYDKQGCPYRGITNVNSEFDRRYGLPGKRIVQLDALELGEGEAELWVDAGNNDLFGLQQDGGRIREAFTAYCDPQARELYYDLHMLSLLTDVLPRTDPQWYEALYTLQKALGELRDYTPEEYAAASRIAKPLLSRRGGEEQSFRLLATGHSHIDLAWRWPIRETKRKGARTFATVLDMMNRYEEYIFGASQPQLYEWIREDHSDLFEKIRRRIAEGRWEVQGAVWVESDTNMPSGESLVRQFLYGNRYWQKEFGKTVDYLWMPDVFGYSAALPQIMKKAGVNYFSTIKISWNKHTIFPYTTFHWKGIDGSTVLTHMPPEGCYLSGAGPEALMNAKIQSAKRGGYFGEALLPFGIGDGGGGAGPSHLEYLRREKNLQGLPPVEIGTVKDFFHRLSESGIDYPTYDGELYLELHQGTLTTCARNKQLNRLSEHALHDAELLSAFAHRLTGFAYPQEELEALWKEVLLYQFHDILPGSSINRVYDESVPRYEAIVSRLEELTRQAAEALSAAVDTSACQEPIVLFNTASFDRRELVPAPGGGYVEALVPANGYAVADLAGEKAAPSRYADFENDVLRVAFAEDGSLSSLYHKGLQRELLEGASNRLLLYADSDDAWDFPYDYRSMPPKTARLESSRRLDDGPIKKVVQTYSYNKSTIELTLSLAGDDSPRLDIEASVDWHEECTMLRIGFAPAVASDTVDCEIQFGAISRTTRSNTEYEQAQYEVCAHNWVALSERGLGFAVLSDSKYGWHAKKDGLEMAVLRGTRFPAVLPDEGRHAFRYAILADDGEAGHPAAVREGKLLNSRIVAAPAGVHGGKLPASHSFVRSDNPAVVIDGVKKAEDSDALVVRTYEACGGKAEADIQLAFPHGGASLAGLMENPLEPVTGKVAYGRFEIQTLLVD